MSIKADIKTFITEQKLKSLRRLKTLLTSPKPGAKTKILSVRFLNAAVTTVDNLAYCYFICSKSHCFLEGKIIPIGNAASRYRNQIFKLSCIPWLFNAVSTSPRSIPHLTPFGHITGSVSGHLLSSHHASTSKAGITCFFGHWEKCLETWALPCRGRGTVLESVEKYGLAFKEPDNQRSSNISFWALCFQHTQETGTSLFCLLLWIYAKQ